MPHSTTARREDLTFRHNIKKGRHGWLRLTPAYSVNVVHQILEQHSDIEIVLDPFSGTGTTGLVCAERGLRCDLFDINPFLIWLARAKTANYSSATLTEFGHGIEQVVRFAKSGPSTRCWIPPLANIKRWWSDLRLSLLSRIHAGIERQPVRSTP